MDRHIIDQNASLREALRMINTLSGEVMTLFAVSADGVMTGTVTDGDIRRGILGGHSLDSKVGDVMNRDFSALRGSAIDVAEMRKCRRRGIKLLPQLNDDGTILRIIDMTRKPAILPLSAILMAGGKGERLRPMTLKTPKPLLEIGGKPIIDYNIEALAAVGIDDISVTVNYLAEQLEEHFSQPIAGVQVKCVRETEPLGTIGSASLIEHREGGETIVMNSDLLTTVSFEEMYLRHHESGADITIGAIPYNLSVPYAILTTEGGRVTALEEKPSYSYYANAGIYIISNRLLSSLPKEERVDATDLIEQAIASGCNVGYYPIDGTWIDIGSPTDFNHARELMRYRMVKQL